MDSVTLDGNELIIKTTHPDKLLALQQKRWSKPREAFVSPAILKTFRILDRLYDRSCWSPEAAALYARLLVTDAARERNAYLTVNREQIDLSLKNTTMFGRFSPYEHQYQALALARDLPEFGYFMEQGTGKTLAAILDAAHQWREDRIELAIVVCPNSVKTNWRSPDPTLPDELKTHMPPDVPWISHVWLSAGGRANQKQQMDFERSLIAKRKALHWLVINIEAMRSSRAQQYLEELCTRYRAMIIVDESTRIKTPGAISTKVMLGLGRYAQIRRIMSGTPIIKAPEHAWAQLRFLGNDAMPFESVTAFKKHFCVISRPQGYKGPEKIEEYKNLSELTHLINRVSFRVLKDQCLDLPPKVYHKLHVDMTAEQNRAYEEMRRRAYVYLEQHEAEINATIILTQMLRLTQIAAGFLPRIDPDTGEAIGIIPLHDDPAHNPKFAQALEVIEETDGKLIIWAHYRPVIEMFGKLLQARHVPYVLFDGSVGEEDRVVARQKFQNESPEKCKIFLGNPAAGGIGLTLTAAEAAIYLTNDFKTEGRAQSEDRCHRVGSEIHKTVNYYDILAANSIDHRVLEVLRNNKRLSDQIMGEGWRSWL